MRPWNNVTILSEVHQAVTTVVQSRVRTLHRLIYISLNYFSTGQISLWTPMLNYWRIWQKAKKSVGHMYEELRLFSVICSFTFRKHLVCDQNEIKTLRQTKWEYFKLSIKLYTIIYNYTSMENDYGYLHVTQQGSNSLTIRKWHIIRTTSKWQWILLR